MGGIVLAVAAGVVVHAKVTKQPTPAPAPTHAMPMPDHKAPGAAPTGMKAMTPPTITAAQTAQLALGTADHKPTTLTFDVNGGMFYYVPNVMHVKKGDTVKINFINDGGTHDFTLDEFGVKIGPIQGGETKSAEFVADKAGTFEYYCSVGSHRAMGQKGTLIVD